MTMVFGVSVTRGPPLETSLSLDITPMPLNPVFEEPTESVMTDDVRQGVEVLVLRRRREQRHAAGDGHDGGASQSPRVNSSISGRAIASPISTTT